MSSGEITRHRREEQIDMVSREGSARKPQGENNKEQRELIKWRQWYIEAAGNGRNGIELDFKHIRFLYDMWQ